MNNNTSNFIFFGGEPLAVPILEKLHQNGFIPKLIVCNPDKPQGRKMKITPPKVAIWAKEHNISIFQPESLKEETVAEYIKKERPDFFIIISYSKIIPRNILEIPSLGSINVHPSLLPYYRGSSPIVAPILNGAKETGVTIIKIDEKMDHGPILAQEKLNLSGEEFIQDLEKVLIDIGGDLLLQTLPKFISGEINSIEQDHTKATFTEKIKKEDGLIDPKDDPIKNYAKFRAYNIWPRIYFFQDNKRIIITKAKLENGKFIIEKIIPEGGKEQDYKINTLK